MLLSVRERLRELAVRAGLAGVPEPVVLAVAAIVVVLCSLAAWRALQTQLAVQGGSGMDAARGLAGTAAPGARAAEPTSASASADTTAVVVDVTGRVRHPGVYRLPHGARAGDALAAAGGALTDADTSVVNLAALVKDGEQLMFPPAGQGAGAGVSSAGRSGNGGASAGHVATPSSARGAGSKVDLNSADAAALDALPGVGPSTAAKIVADREQNGPFKSADDLMRVPGIGPKKFDALKDLITVGP